MFLNISTLLTLVRVHETNRKDNKKKKYKQLFARYSNSDEMDDVAVVQNENENLRKVRMRLLQWESSSDALAPLNSLQLECLDVITNQCRNFKEVNTTPSLYTHTTK